MIYENLSSTTVLITFLLVAMVAIYLVGLLVICVRRIGKLTLPFCRQYYIFIGLYLITKSLICVYLIVKIISSLPTQTGIQDKLIENLFLNSFVISDLILLELFLNAFYFYMTWSQYLLNPRNPSKCLPMCIRFVQVTLIITLTIELVLYNCEIIPYHDLNVSCICLNSLIILLFLSSFFYLNFLMTGVLLQEHINDIIKRIYKLLLVIFTSRIFMVTLEIIISIEVDNYDFIKFIQNLISNSGQQIVYATCYICMILVIVLTQAIPIMYSLRIQVIQSIKQMHPQFLNTSMISNDSQALQKQLLPKDEYNEKTIVFSLRSFNKIQQCCMALQSPIWTYRKAKYNKNQYFIRIVTKQVSNYIIEDVENQINQFKNINLPHFISMNYFLEQGALHLVQKFYPYNLDEMIDKKSNEFYGMRIALKIARAISDFHNNSLIHGSITPTNIFFDENQNVWINGYGLHSLKKYMSLITGYTNKSVYTAIELLLDGNSVVLKPTKQTDIYSFGIIFYEIITTNRQYRHQNLKNICNKFGQQHFRPKIPQKINQQVKNLIRKCWQHDTMKRPKIESIIEILNQLIVQ